MRSLREDERDEIESVKHLIKYVLTKPNIEYFKVYEAVMALKNIGEKYVLSNIVSEKEINELVELDDMKEVVGKFIDNLQKSLEESENK